MKRSITICALLLLFATVAFSQAKKPTIMVVPSETWCIENGYTVDFDNYGVMEKKPDYEKAVLDGDMHLVIAKIGELMAEEGFPLERLDQTIRNIETSEAKLQYMTNRTGGQVVQTPLEKIMQTARPDIRLEVYYKLNRRGPMKSISFEITGIDAYTNVQVASASGTGEEGSSSETHILLQMSINNHIGQFCSQLENHFKDLFENGREVSLEFRCGDDCLFDFYTMVDGKDFYEVIEDIMYEKTENGRFNLLTQDERVVSFNRVRIPLYSENDRPIDVQGWVRRDFLRALRNQLLVDPADRNSALKLEGYNPKVIHEGLGRVTVMF